MAIIGNIPYFQTNPYKAVAENVFFLGGFGVGDSTKNSKAVEGTTGEISGLIRSLERQKPTFFAR